MYYDALTSKGLHFAFRNKASCLIYSFMDAWLFCDQTSRQLWSACLPELGFKKKAVCYKLFFKLCIYFPLE